MIRPLRVAWLGPTPNSGGGVGYMATQVIQHLPAQGVELDLFLSDRRGELPEQLREAPGIVPVSRDSGWRYDQWYSSNPMSTLLTGQATRLWTQRQLMAELRDRHARKAYDVLYQFSQFEPPGLRAPGERLPPLVVHPETHAAGELRAHLRERRLSVASGESATRQAAAVSMFALRSMTQRRAAREAAHVIAPSENFARHLRRDCGLPGSKVSVVANPVDLERFRPSRAARGRPRRIVVAGRVSARKGVELIVELSRRLVDLTGEVELVVVGGESLWSDYRPLLAGLAPAVARYAGPLRGEDMAEMIGTAELLVQPSHYEPFALTVGEALASGVPVVVSDEVGAGERVDPRCCRRFVTGSVDGLERAVRGLLDDLDGDRDSLRAIARSEAVRLFNPTTIAAAVADVLRTVAVQL